MEDMLFQYILKGVARFPNLQALDVGNCSISLTGRTRVRSALRSRILTFYRSFTQLTRLDIRKSELTGNLEGLLDALQTPLEYLNISSCSLNEDDLRSLSQCRHTHSLRELHVSSLVHKGDLKTPDCILDCVENMTDNLVVLEIQNNDIGNDHHDRLCELVLQFKQLKMLDTLYNMMSQSSLLTLVKACAQCASLGCLALNLLPVLGTGELVLERRRAFQKELEDALLRWERRDLTLLVVAIGIE